MSFTAYLQFLVFALCLNTDAGTAGCLAMEGYNATCGFASLINHGQQCNISVTHM